jgi:hypothetical protein
LHLEPRLSIRRLRFSKFCPRLVDIRALGPERKQRLLELECDEVIGWRDEVIGTPETVGVLPKIVPSYRQREARSKLTQSTMQLALGS